MFGIQRISGLCFHLKVLGVNLCHVRCLAYCGTYFRGVISFCKWNRSCFPKHFPQILEVISGFYAVISSTTKFFCANFCMPLLFIIWNLLACKNPTVCDAEVLFSTTPPTARVVVFREVIAITPQILGVMGRFFQCIWAMGHTRRRATNWHLNPCVRVFLKIAPFRCHRGPCQPQGGLASTCRSLELANVLSLVRF